MPRIAYVDVIEPAESAAVQMISQMLEKGALLGREGGAGIEGALTEELGDSKRHVATRWASGCEWLRVVAKIPRWPVL